MGRHSRTRVSRPLLAVLGVVIAIGAGVYWRNTHRGASASADRERLSLKAVTPDFLDVKSGAVPGVHAPPPTLVAASAPTTTLTSTALLSQTPAALDAAPVHASNASTTAPATAPLPGGAASVAASAPVAPTAHTDATLAAAVITPHLLDDAKARVAAGDLLGARDMLNEPLVSGRLSGADADAARIELTQINSTLIFNRKRFKDDPFVTTYQVQAGERLAKIADKHAVTWELLCRINGLADPRKVRAGQWIKVPAGPFHCAVNKSLYRMDVYLGADPATAASLFVMSIPVGLGKDNSTPTGQWVIQQGGKAHPATYYSPRGEGVIAADDPKNPLGGYWMGLTGVSGNAVDKNSYGIHGTIEPDSIGKQASMGCIRLGHDDISLLYDLLVDGKSKVLVKD